MKLMRFNPMNGFLVEQLEKCLKSEICPDKTFKVLGYADVVPDVTAVLIHHIGASPSITLQLCIHENKASDP